MQDEARLREAAEEGDGLSQLILADKLFFGEGVAQNIYEAASWYREAANQGLAEAQNKIGYCYEKALGVHKDDRLSAAWYRKAAEQENIEGQLNLALCYEEGRGVDKDPVKAAQWRRKAAELGDAEAQYLLGMSYESGKGVPQDAGEARLLFRRAAHRGNVQAKGRLNQQERAALEGAQTPLFWGEIVGWNNASREILAAPAEPAGKKLEWEDIVNTDEKSVQWDKEARSWGSLIRGDVEKAAAEDGADALAQSLISGTVGQILDIFKERIAQEKIDPFWIERGQEAVTAVMGALVWLRDNKNYKLDFGAIRYFMEFQGFVKLSRTPYIPARYLMPMSRYLAHVPGYAEQDFNDEGGYVGEVAGGEDCAKGFHKNAALPVTNVLDRMEY